MKVGGVFCLAFLLAAANGKQCGKGKFDFTPNSGKFDYTTNVRELGGAPLFKHTDGGNFAHERVQTDGDSCFLSWGAIGPQVRKARKQHRNKKMAFVGHHIEVNGLPQYDSVPDGIYVNRPSARFLTTSFMLDEQGEQKIECTPPSMDHCFFQVGDKCNQYMEPYATEHKACLERKKRGPKPNFICSYTSTITQLPMAEYAQAGVKERRAQDKARHAEVCASCDRFTNCLFGSIHAQSQCGWDEVHFSLQASAEERKAPCMHEKCSFLMDGTGALVDTTKLWGGGSGSQEAQKKAEQCYQLWSNGEVGGSKKSDWFFKVSSVAVHPSVLYDDYGKSGTVKDFASLATLSANTKPDQCKPNLPKGAEERALQWSCTWTAVSFHSFSKKCAQKEKVSHNKFEGGETKTGSGMTNQLPAWLKRAKSKMGH